MGRAHERKPRRPPTRRAPRRPALPPPSPAEQRLLALARELTLLARRPPGGPAAVAAARRLAEACGPTAALPAELYRAWLASRGDKTRALALAWAREQVRLALEEVLAASPAPALTLRADTLAWLLLAACESLAQELPAAAADRLRVILALTGHAAPA